MLLVWVDEAIPSPDGPRYWGNIAIVFATLVAADAFTASLPSISRSATIRDLDTSPIAKAAFSYMQFLGTVGTLVGQRSYSGQFLVVFVIQVFAFMLTLRRKNLISHNGALVFYALQLVFGFAVSNAEVVAWMGLSGLLMMPAIAAGAMILRVHAGLSKYATWAVVSVVVLWARTTTSIVSSDQRVPWWPGWGWLAAFFLLGGSLAVLQARNGQRKPVS